MKIFFAAFALLCAASCDILRTSPFEVSGWNPGAGFHADPSAVEVRLRFSHDPDRDSVERHFSFAEDGDRVKGNFYWEGRTVRFAPLAPLEANRDYALALSAEAHDRDGLSMDSAFEGRFTTRPAGGRPVLLSIFPEKDAVVDNPRAEVKLVFSRPMSVSSLRDNVTFNPPMTGSWRLTGGGDEAVFTPAELWTHGKRYEMRASSSLAEHTGMTVGKDIVSVFVIGTDHEKPILKSAFRVTEAGSREELAPERDGVFSENSGWEKGDRLQLVFSKAVDALSVKNCLSAEGASALLPETPPGFHEELAFRFETVPAYESRFSFRVKTGVKDSSGNESGCEYVFRIFADGPASMPPELLGVRMPMAPGSPADKELRSYPAGALFEALPIEAGQEGYPSKIEVETWIELYFKTAPGVSVDPLSLMDLFRIETSNSVLAFSPRQIKTEGFSVGDPERKWEFDQRFEIQGTLVNSTNFGVVHILIASGLADTAGNRNAKTFRVSLVK
jgi:hypothetical protein